MNSVKVLYNKIHESLRSPRKVVLKPAWSEGRKDTSNMDGRQTSATSGKHGETCCGLNEGDTLPKIDYRIQGLPHSVVEQEDNTRREVVNKLIHQIETHQDRDALKADLQQNQAYNPFTEKSKNMIHSMENVEFVEMCEICLKTQCSHCLTCWTTGI